MNTILIFFPYSWINWGYLLNKLKIKQNRIPSLWQTKMPLFSIHDQQQKNLQSPLNNVKLVEKIVNKLDQSNSYWNLRHTHEFRSRPVVNPIWRLYCHRSTYQTLRRTLAFRSTLAVNPVWRRCYHHSTYQTLRRTLAFCSRLAVNPVWRRFYHHSTYQNLRCTFVDHKGMTCDVHESLMCYHLRKSITKIFHKLLSGKLHKTFSCH